MCIRDSGSSAAGLHLGDRHLRPLHRDLYADRRGALRPLRVRLQTFIDRRFYRSKYDATQTVDAFSARLRDEVDIDSLTNDLLGVVQESMQPRFVSLWLRADHDPSTTPAHG